MATLNGLRLPDELLHAMERRAAAHGVSLEEQIVRDLQSAAKADTNEGEAVSLGAIRRDRDAMAAKGIFLTDEVLKSAREWGRRDQAWVEERLATASALRESIPGAWITDDEIRAARDEGRP